MGLWNKKPGEEKKPDDQSKSEADLLVERFSAVIDEKIKPVSEAVTGLKSEWETLKAEATKDPPADPNKKADGTDLTAEEKAANREQALFALTVTTNARITENDCLASVQDKWPNVVAEARTTFANTPWQKKAETTYAQYCNNVVDMLVGREAKKGGLRYDRTSSKFLIEDGASSNDGDSSPLLSGDYDWVDPNNPSHRLTGVQQLNKLGINPKEFEEFRKKTGQVM